MERYGENHPAVSRSADTASSTHIPLYGSASAFAALPSRFHPPALQATQTNLIQTGMFASSPMAHGLDVLSPRIPFLANREIRFNFYQSHSSAVMNGLDSWQMSFFCAICFYCSYGTVVGAEMLFVAGNCVLLLMGGSITAGTPNLAPSAFLGSSHAQLGGPSHSSSVPTDAMGFLERVKEQYINKPDVYNEFLETMKEFKEQRLDTAAVLKRVAVLFHGMPHLILGFNTFLPPGYRVDVHGDRAEEIILYTPSGHVLSFSESDLLTERRDPGTACLPCVSIKQHSILDQSNPVLGEFSFALNYVNKIKTRFSDRPEVYDAFLKVLKEYQKDNAALLRTNASLAEKSALDTRIFTEVSNLFAKDQDLLDEFVQFLPDASSMEVPHQPGVRMGPSLSPLSRNDDSPQLSMRRPPSTENPSSSSSNESLVDSSDMPRHERRSCQRRYNRTTRQKRSPSFRLESRVSKRRTQADMPVESICYSSVDRPLSPAVREYAFFSKLRDILSTDDLYSAFICVLKLYVDDYLTANAIVDVFQMNLPLSNKNELLTSWITEFFNSSDADSSTENAVAEIDEAARQRAETYLKLDFKTCRQEGPSYRVLPPESVPPRSSKRSQLSATVLNDVYVSFPLWQSEDTPFVAMKKTQYEEMMMRFDDELYEANMINNVYKYSITAVEDILSHLCEMPEEAFNSFSLNDYSGKTIIWRALKNLYGSRTEEMLTYVNADPIATLPVILMRFKEKSIEARAQAQTCDLLYRRDCEKIYWRSLDHVGQQFKIADSKAIRTRALVTEIDSIYDAVDSEAESRGVRPTARPHIQLTLPDNHEILFDDAKDLLLYCMKKQSGLASATRRKIKCVLTITISTLLGLECEDPFLSDEESSSEDEDNEEEDSSEDEEDEQEDELGDTDDEEEDDEEDDDDDDINDSNEEEEENIDGMEVTEGGTVCEDEDDNTDDGEEREDDDEETEEVEDEEEEEGEEVDDDDGDDDDDDDDEEDDDDDEEEDDADDEEETEIEEGEIVEEVKVDEDDEEEEEEEEEDVDEEENEEEEEEEETEECDESEDDDDDEEEEEELENDAGLNSGNMRDMIVDTEDEVINEEEVSDEGSDEDASKPLPTLHHIMPENHTIIMPQMWFVYFRLHHILCGRLAYFRKCAVDLVEKHDKIEWKCIFRTKKLQSFFSETPIYPDELYFMLLDLLKMLFNNEIDNGQFEENIREIFTIYAYKSYTLDKIILIMIRQMQLMVIDSQSIEALHLCEKWFEQAGDNLSLESRLKLDDGYYKEARELFENQTCYKISFNYNERTINFQLLEFYEDDDFVGYARKAMPFSPIVEAYFHVHPPDDLIDWKSAVEFFSYRRWASIRHMLKNRDQSLSELLNSKESYSEKFCIANNLSASDNVEVKKENMDENSVQSTSGEILVNNEPSSFLKLIPDAGGKHSITVENVCTENSDSWWSNIFFTVKPSFTLAERNKFNKGLYGVASELYCAHRTWLNLRGIEILSYSGDDPLDLIMNFPRSRRNHSRRLKGVLVMKETYSAVSPITKTVVHLPFPLPLWDAKSKEDMFPFKWSSEKEDDDFCSS
ncbi:Paired amphipathic helix protein Sin3b [Trichinella murrelli]|uniref:Paired amphipathic helix protein Sin3b n=1 Tax=Trichinella murrelli TaxID=144512 RepID=A0A0V0UDF1_9BILA|nr:Paired amphipathic helix protein Sin3b [Trichinella murrelli]